MKRNALQLGASAALAFCLAGCGGGEDGSAKLASTPPPPSAPTSPPPSSAVDIFQSPTTQEFAVRSSGDGLRIRYDATTSRYEVMADNQGWRSLVDDPLSSPTPGNPNTNFAFAGMPVNQSFFLIRAHYSYSNPDYRYLYSNFAAWGAGDAGGHAAFGMATPASGVPTTGSATYNGLIEGTATDTSFDYLAGQELGGIMEGTIRLVFNFSGGSLAGSISPTLYLDKKYTLGTLSFDDTVYSTGSASFSGRFDTSLAGNNSFSGLFTGPNAQELIGNFAFPYTSPVTGTTKQSQGAFIAKQ